MDQKIEASIILQMMGRPKEHLEKAAEELIEALGKEKGIKITSKVIHELKAVENKDPHGKVIEISEEQKLFSTFAEVEIRADSIIALVMMCFKYMPSHLEIVEPESFIINNFELNSILNEITAKMHNYDAIAKSAIMQNQILAKRFQEMQKEGVPGIDVRENPSEEGTEKSKARKENKK